MSIILQLWFSYPSYRLVFGAFAVELLSGASEHHRNPLITIQHLFRWWLGAVRPVNNSIWITNCTAQLWQEFITDHSLYSPQIFHNSLSKVNYGVYTVWVLETIYHFVMRLCRIWVPYTVVTPTLCKKWSLWVWAQLTRGDVTKKRHLSLAHTQNDLWYIVSNKHI